MLKPIDVGSSVKFSNIEVKFSDDEMARFLNFDRLNRVHRVSNVSRKNESVRSRRRDKRAWRIAKDVILRIQDEPGPVQAVFLQYLASIHNNTWIKEFTSAADEQSKQKDVPGHAYFQKSKHFKAFLI